MHTKQLHYFLTTAAKGSIAAAARELDVAQPAVSQQLANLEHELNTQLFERDFRGVRLTESGRLFLSHAQSIMHQLDFVKREIRRGDRQPSGQITLGLTQAVCNVLAMPLMTLMERKYPQIELNILSGNSSTVSKWVERNDVDIAIGYDEASDAPPGHYEMLMEEQIFLVVGTQHNNPRYNKLLRKHQVTLADLAEYEVIMPDQKDALSRTLHKYEAKSGISVKRRATFGQLMTTLRYISEGHGLVILPSSATFHLESQHQVKNLPIINPPMRRSVYLITPNERPTSNASSAVINAIREVTQQVNHQQQWQGIYVEPNHLSSDYPQPHIRHFDTIAWA